MAGNGGRPFQANNQAAKGHGRPRGSGRIQICTEFADKEGFALLIALAKGQYKGPDGKLRSAGWAAPDKSKPSRIVWIGPSSELSFDALRLVLAYGKGKPTEFIDVSSGGQSLSDWASEFFGSIPIPNSNGNGHGTAANGNGDDPGLHTISGEDPK